jgi:hypothetical protein
MLPEEGVGVAEAEGVGVAVGAGVATGVAVGAGVELGDGVAEGTGAALPDPNRDTAVDPMVEGTAEFTLAPVGPVTTTGVVSRRSQTMSPSWALTELPRT